MKSEIQIKNSAGVCRIEIEGTIGVPEEWQFDQPEARVATYEKFRDTVRRIAGIDAPQIVVDIRSTGRRRQRRTPDPRRAALARCAHHHPLLRLHGLGGDDHRTGRIARLPRNLGQRPLPDPHGHLCRRRQRRRDSGKTRPAPPNRHAHRRGLCRPFRPPAGEFEALMAENNGNGRWLSPEEAVAAGLADTVTDNGERTAPSLAGNIARGWERLLAGIGLNRREELPADRNVLLTAGERQELLRRSATAIRQAQQNASPTCTKPREDPSYGDTVRTANQRAYAEDAKRFKGI